MNVPIPLVFLPSDSWGANSQLARFARHCQQTTIDADYRFDSSPNAILGKGASSVVRRAVHKASGTVVAVKVMVKTKLSKEDIAGVYTEVEAMEKLRGHPHLVQLLGFYDTKDRFYVVLEFLEGGELFDRLTEKEMYTESDAREAMRFLVDAVEHCHKMGVAHRDLKPENILLKDKNSDTSIKLADFGFAKSCKPGDRLLATACGTPGYVAPEILRRKPYGVEVDVWSLGVIMYILLCGYPPFWSEDETELFRQIKGARFEFHMPEWKDVSREAQDLIRRMLVVSPDDRITTAQIQMHPWMKKGLESKNLSQTKQALKSFNARRRMKRAMAVVRATLRMRMLQGALKAAATDLKKQDAEEAAAGKEGKGAAAAAGGGGGSADSAENAAT